MPSIIEHFGGMWDSQIASNIISKRAATAGPNKTVGDSNRVDGLSAESDAEANFESWDAWRLPSAQSYGAVRDMFAGALDMRSDEGRRRLYLSGEKQKPRTKPGVAALPSRESPPIALR